MLFRSVTHEMSMIYGYFGFHKTVRSETMLRTQKSRLNNEPRVSLALQSVFLRGNRGLDVHVPPPDHRKSWWRLFPSSDANVADVSKQNKRNTAQNRSQKPNTIMMKVRIFPSFYLCVINHCH